jgi:hypothetical protein
MALAIPKYLRTANIQDNVVRYAWDDWKRLPAKETPDDALAARLKPLSQLSQRAVLAFMCGTAEWIVYRFGSLLDDPVPWQYLEGAWAMTINARYCGYGRGKYWGGLSSDHWDGPIRRPVSEALLRVEAAIQQLAWKSTDPVRRAGMIAALAVYVTSDRATFEKWCDQILTRLASLYPRNPEDPLGDVVPREAVDPEYDFHVEQTEALINHFLRSLDYSTSIFLSPPEAMVKHYDEDDEGFDGTPYVFDIEADRRARLEPPSEDADDE